MGRDLASSMSSAEFGVVVVEAFTPDALIGSLWRRLAAYLTDGLVLGVIGTVAGKLFLNAFARLGLLGHLLGFCLAIGYFGWFDSRLGEAQTLGKRWLKLKVVDAQGSTLSLSRAIIRSVIFCVPVYLLGLDLPMTRTPWGVSSLVTAIVYGLGGSTLYLLILGSPARQGFHDVAVGSYVVGAGEPGSVAAKPIPGAHWVVLGSLLLLLAAVSVLFQRKVEALPSFRRMYHDAAVIEQIRGVQRAVVQDALLHDPSTGAARKTLRVSIILSDKNVNQKALAEKAAKLILQNDPLTQRYDEINVRTFSGYDIGIASHWNHQDFTHTPKEWGNISFAARFQ